MTSYGYKPYSLHFDGVHLDGTDRVFLLLRASAPDIVEVQSLISYPDRKGYGRIVMNRLCHLADEMGVRLWLDAQPFGTNRQPISVTKLHDFYGSFDFFRVKAINPHWVTGYHRWDRYRFSHLMMRTPKTPPPPPVGVPQDKRRTPEILADAEQIDGLGSADEMASHGAE